MFLKYCILCLISMVNKPGEDVTFEEKKQCQTECYPNVTPDVKINPDQSSEGEPLD